MMRIGDSNQVSDVVVANNVAAVDLVCEETACGFKWCAFSAAYLNGILYLIGDSITKKLRA
jgi:hypothetical protein